MIQLVTHQRCLDGAACAVLGVAAGFEPHFVYPDGAAPYLDSVPADQEVVLADISLPVDRYPREAHRVVALIDHHQSALGLKGLPHVHLDLSHAASTLLYEWLAATQRIAPDARWEALLRPVDDYDLWRPDHRAGQDINRLLHALGWDWFRAKYHAGFVPFTPDETDRLTALIAAEEGFVARQQARATRFQAEGHPFAVVVLDEEGALNEVAQALLTDGLEGVIMVKPDGRLSARTTTAVDCARLMEAGFTGGGHPRAAGGRLAPEAKDQPAEWVIEQTRRVILQALPSGT